MCEWRDTTLGQLVEDGLAKLQTGPFGTMLHASAYRDTGTPVVAVKHIGDNQLLHEDLPRIDDETVARLGKYKLQKQDILFARKGSVSRRALVKAQEEGWVQGSDCIRLRLDTDKINAVFVSYVFGTRAHRTWIEQHAHGATMPSLNQEILELIPLSLPSKPHQDKIAHILGTLDDKIELNRRMNRTLEAIARAIFKSWFIDFLPVRAKIAARTQTGDPVHAKAEGREPAGMDPETAALFPDSFEDSPLGMIPKGWEISTVGDEFDVTMGQSPPGSTYNEEGDGLPFFQGRRDFGFRYPTKRVFCTDPKRLAETGDTLVTVRAPVGDINMAPELLCVGRGLAAVRHRSGSRSYTYYSMLSLQSRLGEYESEGTVFGAINKSQFSDLKWVAPPNETVAAFENQLFAVDERIGLNEEESFRLAGVRDAVLPELMLGRVP